MKRCLSVSLVVYLLFAGLHAEGTGRDSLRPRGAIPASSGGSVPGWKLSASKPVTFDWYVNFSWFARKWGGSSVSKYITKKTGVDIRFVIPSGNEAEKLNSMISSDSLPDLITLGWWEGQVNMLIDGGYVLPLDELARQYEPVFLKVANPEKLGWYRRSDGHVYGYPNASFTPRDYVTYKGTLTSNQTFLVRKDMYEALGSPDMSTPGGFLAALLAARERYPTVNGEPLIPLGLQEFTDVGNASLESYLQNFLAIPLEKNGSVYDRSTDPEYVRWLKVLRKANQYGLLSTDVFVDKRAQMEEKLAQGRYFALLYQNWDMQAPQVARYNRNPSGVYIAVNGPANSVGADPTLPGGNISGWTITMISKNCRDKVRAIQFLTYLISDEGQMDAFFGVPGETYRMAGGKPEFFPKIEKIDRTDKNAQETKYGVKYTYWMLMDSAWQAQWGLSLPPPLDQPQLWTRPYVRSFAAYDNLQHFAPGSDEAIVSEEIAYRWGKDLPRLLLSGSDAEFDRIWNEFQAYRTQRGSALVQSKQNEQIAVNKAKIGLK